MPDISFDEWYDNLQEKDGMMMYISEKDLQKDDKNDIIKETDIKGHSSGQIGDTDGETTITDIRPIDFNDKTAIAKEINDFAEKYAYADIEYAIVISPNGNMYSLTGTEKGVNAEIIGKDALKGSIGIHNHPVWENNIMGDSFSIIDFKFTIENMQGKQYLVSGERRDAFEFTEYPSSDKSETIWNEALKQAFQILPGLLLLSV